MADYKLSGGINTIPGNIDHLDIHGGVCYLQGNVDSMTHYGGIVYDQRRSDRVEIRESEMSQQLKRYYQKRIEELETKVTKIDYERSMLRSKLDKLKEIDPEQDSDDVLVQRICTLRNELAKEKEAHKKDVEDLNYRLDVAMDINASLRHRIDDEERKSQEIADRHVDILASLMALYPFTPTEDLSFEFGLPPNRISYVATALKVVKSKDERDQAREYLQKQGLQLVERRGGDQGNYPDAKPVEKVGKYGRLIKSYDSLKAAARDNGLCAETVRDHCNRYHKANKIFTKDGYTFRFKKK
jgi:DNA repair exonuclease SbcCD ATPase subunit